MIECEIRDNHINFGGNAFCNVCGMDLDFNPIKNKQKGQISLYYCENCANVNV